ncbi:MAG: ATP-grasp domain-containing protein [Nitrososphaeraceae archaeon]
MKIQPIDRQIYRGNYNNKTTKANVLVTATGSIVAQGIIKCLKLANAWNDSPVNYRIIATDMSAQAAGLYRCDMGILVPSASSPDYIDSIIKISREQNVHAIYVGSDVELIVLGDAKERIEHETGAKLLTSPIGVLITARDKWKTFKFLNANNLPNAASSLPEDNEKFTKEFGYPVVVKPREGYGSKLFSVANNRDEMEYAVSKIQRVGWNPILQEYLKDDEAEFTSGITVDRFGKYTMSSISIRKIVKNGQTYKAFIDSFESIRRSAEEVALKLGARGAINIQAKLRRNEPKIFEINPRFSATCPMRSAAGINEPDIVFRNLVLGEDIKVDAYQRLICMRYWNEVYVQYATYEKTSNTRKIEDDNNSFIIDYF